MTWDDLSLLKKKKKKSSSTKPFRTHNQLAFDEQKTPQTDIFIACDAASKNNKSEYSTTEQPALRCIIKIQE